MQMAPSCLSPFWVNKSMQTRMIVTGFSPKTLEVTCSTVGRCMPISFSSGSEI